MFPSQLASLFPLSRLPPLLVAVMPSPPPPSKRLLLLLTTFAVALSSVQAQAGRIKCNQGSRPHQAICENLEAPSSRRGMRVPLDSQCHQDTHSGDWFCGYAGAACVLSLAVGGRRSASQRSASKSPFTNLCFALLKLHRPFSMRLFPLQ